MKSVAELQNEIRSLKNEMNKRMEIIETEVADFKEKEADPSVFDQIYEMALLSEKISHPICEYSIAEKNAYFGALFLVVTSMSEASFDQLLFMQRIILNDKNKQRLNSYIGQLGEFDRETLIYCLDQNIKNKLSRQLIMDMMILAAMGNDDKKNAYLIIADIAFVMRIGKDELIRISKMAKVVLSQELTSADLSNDDIIYTEQNFEYYFNSIKNWKDKLESAKQSSESLSGEKMDTVHRIEMYSELYDLRQFTKLYNLLIPFADSDNIAQNALGCVYAQYFAITQRKNEYKDKATFMFCKAIQGNYAPAMYNLALCYFVGFGVVKNREVASNWYNKARSFGLSSDIHLDTSLKFII